MEFWVDKFTFEIKDLIEKKRKLIAERDKIRGNFKAAEAYFTKIGSKQEIQLGAERMLELSKKFLEIDNEISDIDIVIASNLEIYLGNFTARVKMPDRLNDAGDLIRHDCVYAVPFKSGDENLKEVVPDDIWFLKLIKTAFKATNVTFIEKEE